MPNCCVPGCKNSSYRGYLMRSFPKDKTRCEEWVKNINKPNWTPNSAHRVCEVHFAPEMWEKMRVDGSRKLKYNAVPTVFGDDITDEKPSMSEFVPPLKNKNIDKNISPPEERNLLKNINLNNHTLIKILPPHVINSTSPSIVVPFSTQSINSTGAIIVNTKGKIVNTSAPSTISSGASILKSMVKTTSVQSSPMLISTNASILKNQIKAASNQTPIIIPAAGSSILKPQIQNQNLSATLVHPQSMLIPLSVSAINQKRAEAVNQKPFVNSGNNLIAIKPKPLNINTSATQAIVNTSASESKSVDESASETSTTTATTTTTTTTSKSSIILNKIEAQKMDEERFAKMDKLLLKQLKLNNALRKKLVLMNRRIQALVKEQNKSNSKSFLKDVFTEDQVRALELKQMNPRSITAWSQKTMMKALRLKQECGTRGYEELLKQHMPLPSIRTLSRWCATKEIAFP